MVVQGLGGEELQMSRLSKHFTEKELGCRCGCGCRVTPGLVDLLESIRAVVGLPILVNSGYRCEARNAREGGVPNSYHVQGMAADIRCSGMTADALWRQVRDLAIQGRLPTLGGLGRYTGRIHVDVRPRSGGRFAEWDYRGRGKR